MSTFISLASICNRSQFINTFFNEHTSFQKSFIVQRSKQEVTKDVSAAKMADKNMKVHSVTLNKIMIFWYVIKVMISFSKFKLTLRVQSSTPLKVKRSLLFQQNKDIIVGQTLC